MFSIIFLSAVFAGAQVIDASTPGRQAPPKEELPKSIKESLMKQRIQKEKEEHDELLQRGEEALKLSEEIEKSVTQTNKVTSADREKLDRLEKIVKKIRKDLGGDDDDNAESNKLIDDADKDKPSTIVSAINKLQSTATKLFDELKKTTRFSISAVAIQSSNSLLKIVKFIRFTN